MEAVLVVTNFDFRSGGGVGTHGLFFIVSPLQGSFRMNWSVLWTRELIQYSNRVVTSHGCCFFGYGVIGCSIGMSLPNGCISIGMQVMSKFRIAGFDNPATEHDMRVLRWIKLQ